MQLIINGNQIEVPSTIQTVSELLQHLDLNQKVIIVEKNEEILEKAMQPETLLSPGDKIELVHFVGGG